MCSALYYKRTNWIHDYFDDDPLSLPIGISLFLINMQCLNQLNTTSINDRFYIYLHWTLNFSKNFGQWKLRKKDVLAIHSILKRVTLTSENFPIQIPFFLRSIHKTRSDVRGAFDIDTLDGRLQLLLWWKNSYLHEIKSIKHVSDIKLRNSILFPWKTFYPSKSNYAYLYKPWMRNKNIPYFLGCIWESREDLKALCDVASDLGIATLLNWWRKYGQFEYHGLEFK